jgi:mono/diheme cytochrome c family protein
VSTGVDPRVAGERSALRSGFAAALTGLALLAGCAEKEFDPPDPEERVALAEADYATARFDTVGWESDAERQREGNDAYAVHCRSCHGPLGRGETAYARGRGLEVPSLVEPGWAHAGDVEAVRRRIYVGHPAGMPAWGLGRMTPREIDAVAFYIVTRLRPDAGAAP